MSSSSKKQFSNDELEALSIWDAPKVSGKGTEGYSQAITARQQKPRILTVEEIEKVQSQAFTEAFKQGKQAGHEEGIKQGLEEGRKKGYDENLHLLQQQSAHFVSLLESLSEPFKELDEKVEQELLKLAMVVASQIIRREIKIDSGQVIAAVREAVSILPMSSQHITLHLHPEDAELVRSALSLDEMSPPWTIIEEPLLTRGGCNVVTETSSIDASVENRISAVIANVLGDERDQIEPR
jgi:flagellar assembly protein FliH